MSKKSSIYTRRGDKGLTELYTGQKVRKDNERFDVLGNMDKLNVQIGIVYTMLKDKSLTTHIEFLKDTQQWLITLGGYLGSDKDGQVRKMDLNMKDDEKIIELEKRIDELSESLPRLISFITFDSIISCRVHMCRVTTREVERGLVKLCDTKDVYILERKYFNRLSDYFFELGRAVKRDERKYEEESTKSLLSICTIFCLLFLVFARVFYVMYINE